MDDYGRQTTDYGRQKRTMDDGGADDGGFWTADRGPQTALVILADGPIPWLSSFLLASIPPPVVIPETGGRNLYMNENASSARYPGSPQGWLLWTKESDDGPWTTDEGLRTTEGVGYSYC